MPASKKGVHFSDTDTYAVYQEIRISTSSTNHDEPVSPTASFIDLPTTFSIASSLRPRFLTSLDNNNTNNPLPSPNNNTDSYLTTYNKSDPGADTVDAPLRFSMMPNNPSNLYNNMSDDSRIFNNNMTSSESSVIGGPSTWNVKQRRSRASIEASHKGRYLNIGPANGLTFDAKQDEPINFIQISNNSDAVTVAFKVKTTSPEKFRVRPSLGIVLPGETVNVEVGLLSGYANTAGRDKFLILSVRLLSDPAMVDLADFWHKMEAYLKAQESGTKFDVGSMSEEYAALAQQQDAFRMRCNIVNLTRPEQEPEGSGDANNHIGNHQQHYSSLGGSSNSLENLSLSPDFVFSDKELGIIAHKIDRLARSHGTHRSVGLLDSMAHQTPRKMLSQLPNFFFNFVMLYIMVKLVDWLMSRFFNQIEPF